MNENKTQFEQWLQKAKNESAEFQPSDQVWSKIQKEIQNTDQKESWLEKVTRIFTPPPQLQAAIVGSALVVMAYFLVMNPKQDTRLITENEAAILASDIDRKVFESQRLYEEVLTVLEKQVTEEIPSDAHEVFDLYKEKIKMLDILIAECKVNLKENPYNPEIHKSLFYAYTEKLTNLKTMLALNKEILS